MEASEQAFGIRLNPSGFAAPSLFFLFICLVLLMRLCRFRPNSGCGVEFLPSAFGLSASYLFFFLSYSVGYLALTRKSYGNTKASHEIIQCNPTERKCMVASSTFVSDTFITFSTWKFKHLTTYASLIPTVTTSVYLKTRKPFTLGILTHQVGTRSSTTM
jgi:hypothetical protein